MCKSIKVVVGKKKSLLSVAAFSNGKNERFHPTSQGCWEEKLTDICDTMVMEILLIFGYFLHGGWGGALLMLKTFTNERKYKSLSVYFH